jgi:hypothetical protein
VTNQDWKRIESELDDLKPGARELNDHPAPLQPRQPTGGWANEEMILKHIAEALRLD